MARCVILNTQREASWSSGRHSASERGDPVFESRLCRADVKSMEKTLYMHLLSSIMCKRSARQQAVKDLVSILE